MPESLICGKRSGADDMSGVFGGVSEMQTALDDARNIQKSPSSSYAQTLN
jgi:hypothetical protein